MTMTAEQLPTEDGAVVRWRGRDRIRRNATLDYALGDEERGRLWVAVGIGILDDATLMAVLEPMTDVEVWP